MKGAVLKRVPGSGGRPTKKKKDKTKLYSSPPKVLFRDPIGHELPASLQNFRWNVDKVERKLQEKIQEKTLIAGNFVYQQAYRLLEGTRGEGIDFPSFREQLRMKFGIILTTASYTCCSTSTTRTATAPLTSTSSSAACCRPTTTTGGSGSR